MVFHPAIGRSPGTAATASPASWWCAHKKGITTMSTRDAVIDRIDTHTQPTVPTLLDDATEPAPTRPRCQWQRDVDGRLRMRWS
jgi:hypothetical protein